MPSVLGGGDAAQFSYKKILGGAGADKEIQLNEQKRRGKACGLGYLCLARRFGNAFPPRGERETETVREILLRLSLTCQTRCLKFTETQLILVRGDMDERPPDVTDAELAVLQTLWEQGTATIRQLTDTLYPQGTAAHYGTVQKLLERLEAKGCIRRDRDAWPHRFSAAIDRETLIGWQLRTTAEKLCGGSMAPLLLHLLKTEQFSSQERRELRTLLDQLTRGSQRRDPGRKD
jgi:BlaI family penicillinase repressor